MAEILIIADDLTGALDTCVQFAKKGMTTRVLITQTFPERADADVLCIDAETRHLTPEEAYRVVYGIAAAARSDGVRVIFKKVDSTLRGQIGSELSAVVDALDGQERLHFVPAYPQCGRTTRRGVQYLHGVPISESPFVNDPFDPVVSSRIAEIVHAQTDLPVYSACEGREVPAGACAVYDAQTEGDLFRIAETLVREQCPLIAGCAGLAIAYCSLLEGRPGFRETVQKTDGIFIISGSLNQTSVRQIRYAQEHGYAHISLTEKQRCDSAYLESPEGADFLEMLRTCCTEKKRVILDTCRGELLPAQDRDINASRRRTAANLARYGNAWLSFGLPQTLMIVGGDTLFAFMTGGAEKDLRIKGELAPGVVCADLFLEGERACQLISKAGGFGAQTLYADLEALVL